MRRRHLTAGAVSALALAWCLLAAAPPWLHHAGRDGYSVATRLLLGTVCHQIPSRSFTMYDEPLGVCSRCAGLYGGFLAGCLASLALGLARRRPAGFPPAWLMVPAAMPLAVEWALGHAGWIRSTNMGRAATGLLFGCVVAFFFIPAIDEMCGEILAMRRRRAATHRREHAAAT